MTREEILARLTMEYAARREQRYEQRPYDPAEFEGYTPEQLEEMKRL